MEERMISYVEVFSTAGQEKEVSTGTDDLEHTQATLTRIFIPPGEYRMIAGNWLRVHEGIPASDKPQLTNQNCPPSH